MRVWSKQIYAVHVGRELDAAHDFLVNAVYYLAVVFEIDGCRSHSQVISEIFVAASRRRVTT